MASRNLHADELLLEQKEFQGSMIQPESRRTHGRDIRDGEHACYKEGRYGQYWCAVPLKFTVAENWYRSWYTAIVRIN